MRVSAVMKSDKDTGKLQNNIVLSVMILLASLSVMDILSWVRYPNLAVTARLSTAPVVVVLCILTICLLLNKFFTAAKILLLVNIAVLALGRFTFSFMGGAPEIRGWTVFEIRYISELMIPVVAFILMLTIGKSHFREKRLLKDYCDYFICQKKCLDNYRRGIARRGQIILSILALMLSIYGEGIGGYNYLNAIFAVPLIIFATDDRISKYLVSVVMLTKLVYDLSSYAFLGDSALFPLVIALDILSIVSSLFGSAGMFSIALSIQITLVTGMMLYCACCTVARDNYFFFRNMSMYIAELSIYTNYLLFAVGQIWTDDSILRYYKKMFLLDEDPEDIELLSEEMNEW